MLTLFSATFAPLSAFEIHLGTFTHKDFLERFEALFAKNRLTIKWLNQRKKLHDLYVQVKERRYKRSARLQKPRRAWLFRH